MIIRAVADPFEQTILAYELQIAQDRFCFGARLDGLREIHADTNLQTEHASVQWLSDDLLWVCGSDARVLFTRGEGCCHHNLQELSVTHWVGTKNTFEKLTNAPDCQIHLISDTPTKESEFHQHAFGQPFVIGAHAELAAYLFRCGYNCAQSVFGAFAEELGIGFSDAMRLSCSFGGGMGRMREVCGAVSGMLMVCGYTHGYETPETGVVKAEHYRLVQQLGKSFRDINSSIICRELLGGSVSASPEPTARTEEFYRTRPCERLIRCAAELAENLLES